jgi:beta-glucosidase
MPGIAETVDFDHIRTDFINRFREDVALMKQAGLTHYRTSINWSRFLTDYENVVVDEEYAAYYDELFAEMHRQGIEPMICLEHYELPGTLPGNIILCFALLF